ncbi:type II toxin-antitoxin system VapC family toxin [Candidatus Poribacteria bacterium]|nr:type II toxin-antitoxin system VapC family toxin [Candidatus Poribacteria bacterium]
MSYVTDAHSLVWYFMDDPKLSQNARDAFEGTVDSGVIIVPTIVLAEIMYISRKGKIPITFEDTLSRLEGYENFWIVPLDIDILKVAANIDSLEMHDRLIIATALYFDVPLITKDEQITKSQVISVIW